jgi:PAS domain S-box-containing protein
MEAIDQQQFVKKYLLTFSLALFGTPLIGAVLEIFLGTYTLNEIIQAVRNYTIFYIFLVYFFGFYITKRLLQKYSDKAELAIAENNSDNFRKSVIAISSLILFNLIFILIYAQGGPFSVNYYIASESRRLLGNTEELLSYINTLPALLIILFPVYFYLQDLLARYLASRLIIVNTFPIRNKILILGTVIPLLVDMMLILFYYDRTSYFHVETMILWLLLMTIAAAGTLLAYRSFKASLEPLQGTLNLNDLNQIEYTKIKPNSFDEIGQLAYGWQFLLDKNYKATQALVHEKNFSSTIINNANALFIVLDRHGNIVEFNQGCEKTTGYMAEEVLGQKVWDYFIVAEEIRDVQKIFNTLIDQPINNSYQNYWRVKGDGRRLIDWSNSSVMGEDGYVKYIISIGIDVTDRNSIEDELRRSKDTLDRAQAIAHIGHWDWNIQTNDLAWSDETFRIFGLTPQEFEATYPAFLQRIHPDDVDNVTQAVTRSVEHPDNHYNIEHRIVRPDGEIRIVHEQGEIYRDQHNTPLRMVGTVHDITERVRAEEAIRKLNAELEERVVLRTHELESANQNLAQTIRDLKQTQNHLVESEKMAALGGLVAGVAHEINTPLGIGVTAASHLDMKLQVYQNKYNKGELSKSDFEAFLKTTKESTDILQSNLKRASRLIRSFKQIAVDQSSERPRVFNLAEYVDEIINSLNPHFKSGDYLINNNTSPSLQINSYPGAISQIITNLILNSIIHGFEEIRKGEINIELTAAGDLVKLNYSDNGAGIDEENLKKIFDPFFTTRRDHGGSGLGMNIIYNIVTQTLGGNIDVESKPGQGVHFSVIFPQLGDEHEMQ